MSVKDLFKRKTKTEKIKKVKARPKLKFKIGLTLSGGGARGFAHIGAIKAFEEEGIDFDFVTGTSAGSIVGALYAAGLTSAQMVDIAKVITVKEIRNSSFILKPSNSKNIENILKKYIGDITFDQLEKPFSCSAVDIISGNEIVLNSGSVCKACSASSAVPILFKAVIWDEYRLVDGGLQNTIPADIVRRMGAEYVVSIDLNSTRGGGTDSTSIKDVLWATWTIAMKNSALKGTMFSDIVVEPDLKRFSSTSLNGREDMIEEGYRATKARMNEIKYALGLIKEFDLINEKAEGENG